MKTRTIQIFRAVGCITLLTCIAGNTACATLTKLAATDDAEPGGTNTFFQIGQMPTLSEDGKVAFYTDLRDSGFLKGWGLFLADGATVRTVARTGQPSPDLNGNFYTLNSQVALNSTSQVFEVGLNGTLAGGTDDSGIYQLSGGVLTILARAGQLSPEGGAVFRSFSSITPRVNRSGQAAFLSSTSTNPYAMYRSTAGVLRRLAYYGQQSPDGNGGLLGLFSAPALNNRG